MRVSLYRYCVNQEDETLLRQWHTARNSPLTPQTVTYGSRRKLWWHCERGHEWRAAVYTRAGGGAGCPYCAGKTAWPGENDLASKQPELAAQWHPVKNRGLTPQDVPVGSHKKVWWICEKGHEWQAIVKSRVSGCGCPICSNRTLLHGENDLAATHPELAAQWHPDKNGALTPRDVIAGTRRKVWWKCAKGHQWQATVASRVNGAGCPVCAGKTVVAGENDLLSLYPAVAAQWDPLQNGILTPQRVSPYSNRKVWWRCDLGHSYQATVGSRTTQSSGCPYCAGRRALAGFNDLAALEPQVAAQWHPTLNGALTPQMVTVGSHKKVWWQCPDGHVWKAMVYSRAGPQKCGCPVCAGRTKARRGAGHTPPPAISTANHGEHRI